MARFLASVRLDSARRVRNVLGACVAACAVLVGCASRPTAPDRAGAPPDFSLSVTVGAGAADFVGARYVVEPGGAFRAAIGEGATPDLHPAFTRRLSPEETDALWRAAAALRSPARVGSEHALFASGASVVLWVRADESTRVYAPDTVRDAAAASLLDQLETLAWVW